MTSPGRAAVRRAQGTPPSPHPDATNHSEDAPPAATTRVAYMRDASLRRILDADASVDSARRTYLAAPMLGPLDVVVERRSWPFSWSLHARRHSEAADDEWPSAKPSSRRPHGADYETTASCSRGDHAFHLLVLGQVLFGRGDKTLRTRRERGMQEACRHVKSRIMVARIARALIGRP